MFCYYLCYGQASYIKTTEINHRRAHCNADLRQVCLHRAQLYCVIQ